MSSDDQVGLPGPNPLLEKQRESRRTTINGVPMHLLNGRLPPPRECTECQYPAVWLLVDPDAVQADDANKRGQLVMLGEYDVRCMNTDAQFRLGPLAVAPNCGHPYHLVPHDCRPGHGAARLVPAFPSGLIVRPPA